LWRIRHAERGEGGGGDQEEGEERRQYFDADRLIGTAFPSALAADRGGRGSRRQPPCVVRALVAAARATSELFENRATSELHEIDPWSICAHGRGFVYLARGMRGGVMAQLDPATTFGPMWVMAVWCSASTKRSRGSGSRT